MLCYVLNNGCIHPASAVIFSQGLNGRRSLYQRRGVDGPPRAPTAIAGVGDRGGTNVRRRTDYPGLSHQLLATATDVPVAVAAAATVPGAAATAVPAAAADIRPRPFESSTVLGHAGVSAPRRTGGATSLVAGEKRSPPAT